MGAYPLGEPPPKVAGSSRLRSWKRGFCGEAAASVAASMPYAVCVGPVAAETGCVAIGSAA